MTFFHMLLSFFIGYRRALVSLEAVNENIELTSRFVFDKEDNVLFAIDVAVVEDEGEQRKFDIKR